jgi:hypothetical protein
MPNQARLRLGAQWPVAVPVMRRRIEAGSAESAEGEADVKNFCEKCGWCGRIDGPHYVANYANESGYSVGERLVYRCVRCSYEWTEPTLDRSQGPRTDAPRES